MKVGANPAYGGKGGESGFYKALGLSRENISMGEEASGWNCKGRFFVFLESSPEPIKRWQPRIYSIAACVGENCSPEQNKLVKAFFIALSIFEGFCSPTLKFRFSDRFIKFKWDKTFNQRRTQTVRIAGYTEQYLSPDRIGLYGSLSEGLNQKWKERISANPRQFMKGLVKLAITVALVASMIAYCVKAFFIYAGLKGVQILGRLAIPLFYNLEEKAKSEVTCATC